MRRAAVLLAGLLALSGCERADDAAFGARVRAYLLEHPEVLEEASTRLNAQRQAAADQQLALALNDSRRQLERDPRDYVANPNGRVTLTQFYDYRCSFCITVAPEVLELIRTDPDLRVVFKELPTFGQTSERAARLALAVRRANGDYLGVYRTLMSVRPLDDAAVDRIATAYGVAPASLDGGTSPAETQAHLAAVREMADRLRIDGTPTFVVGQRVIPGADIVAIRQAIAETRAAAART